MFTHKVGESFRSIIFLKVSDEYVLRLEYSGETAQMYEYAIKSFNSVKVDIT